MLLPTLLRSLLPRSRHRHSAMNRELSAGQYEEALEKAKGTFSKELADLKANFEKKLKKSNEAVESYESDKKNYILDEKIRRAVIKAGVFTDDVDDVLLPHRPMTC